MLITNIPYFLPIIGTAICLVLVLTLLLIWLVKLSKRKRFLEKKYTKFIEIDKEFAEYKQQKEFAEYQQQRDFVEYQQQIALEKSKLQDSLCSLADERQNLDEHYQNLEYRYDKLLKTVALFEEEVDMIEFGFYQPHFDFEASETFKTAIVACKQHQKKLMKKEGSTGAIYCSERWQINNSYAAGKKMTARNIKLAARAFNSECDAAIANCTWKNIVKMKGRIEKAYETINKLGLSNAISITPQYLDAKIEELQLTYEYHAKKQAEKEEQAAIKAQMREEARVEQEIRKAEAQAKKEEMQYQQALSTARDELRDANEQERLKLEEQISQLETNLQDAEMKYKRAQSMAEQTKQGHVYIISNIGSFGENIYKIGMTRRLEPMDRIKELGAASVPFNFDVHAMIHTNNAPELENALHRKFNEHRLNKVNHRKEFFSVSLNDIKSAVQALTAIETDFIETAVAQEYYESKKINATTKTTQPEQIPTQLSASNQAFAELADVI